VSLPSVELTKPVRASAEDRVQEAQVSFFFIAPAANTPGSAEAQLLAMLLGGSQTSRLVKHLVVEQQLCESVEANYEKRRGQSLFSITATAQGGHSAAEIEKALEKELAALFAAPPTAAEVSRVQARMQTHLLQMMETPFGVADALNEAQQFVGDPGDVERNLLARYDVVTPTGVFEQARRMLTPNRLTVVITPKKGGAK
jgi:predicted Zn-dependent peptidase